MSDTTAQIAGKGLDGTGLTEDMAAELFHQVGKHMMAIVELQVTDKHGPNLKGKRKVTLSLTQVWPADDPTLDDHLRELTKVLHQNAAVVGADGSRQAVLLEERDGIEPTVEGVINANPGLKPHPYLTSQLAIDDTAAGPVCDVCGKVEGDVIHHMPATDPFATVDEDEDEEPEAELDEDRFASEHEYEPGPDDSCLCGAAANAEIHWWPDTADATPDERHLTAVD